MFHVKNVFNILVYILNVNKFHKDFYRFILTKNKKHMIKKQWL
jgi:hypothetical protein